jgi:hypothetical protein
MMTTSNGMPPPLPHTFTISPAQQRAIIEQEITLWIEERYRMELRRRIQARPGGDADLISAINTRLVQCEAALDVLQAELAGLEPPAQAESGADRY